MAKIEYVLLESNNKQRLFEAVVDTDTTFLHRVQDDDGEWSDCYGLKLQENDTVLARWSKSIGPRVFLVATLEDKYCIVHHVCETQKKALRWAEVIREQKQTQRDKEFIDTGGTSIVRRVMVQLFAHADAVQYNSIDVFIYPMFVE